MTGNPRVAEAREEARRPDGRFGVQPAIEAEGGVNALSSRTAPPRGEFLYRIVQEDVWADSVSRDGFRAGSEYWHTLDAALQWADDYEATTGVACRVMEVATPDGCEQTDDPRGTSFAAVEIPVTAMRVARTFDGEIIEAPPRNENAAARDEALTFDEVVEAGGVTDAPLLARSVQMLCGINPITARFRRTTLALEDVPGYRCDPEDYLIDGDDDGYETATSLAEAYTAGDDVPPIVYGWDKHITDGIQVLDGFHRLSGARSAGLSEIPAFEVTDGGAA